MNKTAIEWLQEALENTILTKEQVMQTIGLFEQAKDMEKEQLKQLMWDLTDVDMNSANKGWIIDNLFEQYCNETFKSE